MSSSRLNLRELEALRAFVESGSITRAAARLNRTQPQISRLLASLEVAIGFPIFVRRSRRLQLTDKGREFYRHVEGALGIFDQLKQFAARAQKQHNNHVRVLTAPQITEPLVADALAAMAVESPGFTATIDARTRGGIEFWVEHEQFDLGITVLPFEHPMYEVEEFLQSSAVAVMAGDHPLATKRTVSVDDLLAQPFIATSLPSVLRQRFEKIAHTRGAAPEIRFETPNGAIACQLAARGMGLALADPFVALSTARRGVAIRPFEPRIELDYAFLYPVGQKRSAAVTSLAAHITEIARQKLRELDGLRR